MTDEQREDIAVLVSTVDVILPAVGQAIAAEWDRGNYINGPRFGAALERLRQSIPTRAIDD